MEASASAIIPVGARPSSKDRAIRVLNFRDVGGFACAEGRRVRRGRLFRSATPDFATPTDVLFLERLGIRTVLDLRTSPERRMSPLTSFDIRHLPLLTQVWDPGMLSNTAMSADRFLADRYLDMTEAGAVAIAECFHLLAETPRSPALVHCTAGKDRTGVLVALVLSSLGVAHTAIAEDYGLSSLAMPELVGLIRDHTPDGLDAMVSQPSAFLSSPQRAMDLLLGDLAARHGSTVGYLHSIGVHDGVLDTLAEQFTDR